MADRSCGTCTLCCKLIGVTDLEPEKPAGQWCSFCDRKGGGCNAYDERPEGCSNFSCLWLAGIGDDRIKPERCKVVLSFAESGILQVHVEPTRSTTYKAGVIGKFLSQYKQPYVVIIGDACYVYNSDCLGDEDITKVVGAINARREK